MSEMNGSRPPGAPGATEKPQDAPEQADDVQAAPPLDDPDAPAAAPAEGETGASGDELEPTDEPEPAGDDVDELPPVDEGEPPVEGEPPPPHEEAANVQTPEALEKQRKALDRAEKTWRGKVRDILGADAAELVPCELCDASIPGYHFPAEFLQPETELEARLVDVLLETVHVIDYRPAPDVTACETCGGFGKVLTGSKVPTKDLKTCPTCRGYGFTPPPDVPAGSLMHPEGELVEPGDAVPMVQDEVDGWGSPKHLADGSENPNWGRMPQYKDRSLP